MAGGAANVLLVSHDAARAGAPICVRELADVLQRELGRQVELALCADGDLAGDFAALAPLTRLHAGGDGLRRAASACFLDFRTRAPAGLIVISTAAVPEVYQGLDDQSIRDAVAWIHELPETIDRSYGGAETIELIRRVCQRIVVPSEFARRALCRRYQVPEHQIMTVANGVAAPVLRAAQCLNREQARSWVRAGIGADGDARLVLGCGMPEACKGVDLFARVAAAAGRLAPELSLHFVWMGKETDAGMRTEARTLMASAGRQVRLTFVGQTAVPEFYYAAADLVLITSRLDSSPLVNGEAIAFGLPVLFFDGCGGTGELHLPGLDLGVPGFDTGMMAGRALQLLRDDARRQEIGRALREHAQAAGGWRRFAERLDDGCATIEQESPSQ